MIAGLKARLVAGALGVMALAGCSMNPVDGITNLASMGQLGGSSVCTGPVTGVQIPGMSAEENAKAMVVAQKIANVGIKVGAGTAGIAVGHVVALTESTMQELDYGDVMNGVATTSAGPFQQIAAWDSNKANRVDATTSAEMFFTGGKAGQKGLLDIDGWQQMPIQKAAQAVEQSQFADGSNYAKNLELGRKITDAVLATCTSDPAAAGGGVPASSGAVGGRIVAAAMKWVGTPYVWGGGGPAGPSGTDYIDGRGPGFDCSGLVQYAVAAATGQTIARTAAEQATTAGVSVPSNLAAMQPGDLIAFDDGAGSRVAGADHIGIYIGNGQMVNAPNSRADVRIDSLTTGSRADTSKWIVRRVGAGGAGGQQ